MEDTPDAVETYNAGEFAQKGRLFNVDRSQFDGQVVEQKPGLLESHRSPAIDTDMRGERTTRV